MEEFSHSSPGRRRVLEALLAEGPQTARELAARLRVTSAAVRQHLTALAAEDLAEPEAVSRGLGRPASRWRAGTAAQGSMADGHTALSTELLAALSAEGSLDRVLERRSREQLERYEARVPPSTDLARRIEILARLRSDEGYMARAWTDADGTVFLAENHCPLQCAVQTCAGLCEAEEDLFRRFVGPGIDVDRIEHLGSGGRRCVYRFGPVRS